MFSTMKSVFEDNSLNLNKLDTYILDYPYVRGWFCGWCNETIHGGRENFKEHCLDAHKTEVKRIDKLLYPCDVCGYSFLLKDPTGMFGNYCQHWLQHFFQMELVPSKEIHKCDRCVQTFSAKYKLLVHRNRFHRNQLRTNGANNASSATVGSSTANNGTNNNNNSSTKNKIGHWVCKVCGKAFNSASTHKRHRNTVHLGKKRSQSTNFKCDSCDLAFNTSRSRHYHVMKVHQGEKLFSCELCDQRFFVKHHLRTHVASTHKNKIPASSSDKSV